jgi:predicted Zn-dependent protease
MEAARAAIEKILAKPVTDHVVIALTGGDTHFIRFSNSAVNRENLQAPLRAARVEVGYDGRTGVAKTNDTSEEGLRRAVARAHEAARLLPKDPEYMPPVTPSEAAGVKKFEQLFFPPSDEVKYGMLDRLFADLRSAGLKAAGSLSVNPHYNEVYNSSGLRLAHAGCFSALAVTAMTGDSSFKDTFYSRDLADYAPDSFISGLTEKARLSANPSPLEPGKYTVVLAPAAVEELLLMFLGYNMNAKAMDEGRTALSSRREKNIAAPGIRIYSRPDHPVSPCPFSPSDGAPYPEFDMIAGGRLVQPWYSRYYAAKKGALATGRGTPGSVILAGTDRPAEELVKGVEDGLYVNSFWYIRQVDQMDAVFTGMTRDGLFRIKDGRLAGSVNNFRFNQSVFALLENTTDIGKEKGMVYASMPHITVKDFNFVSSTGF